jgi:polyphosphate:AMP phosphotransferase
MFEGAELGRKVSKEDYQAQIDELRTQLVEAQLALRGSEVPVIVIVAGVDGAGRGEVVNRLHEWFDTRGMQVQSYWEETDEERDRPYWWRFWRTLPERGSIGILFGSWYTDPTLKALDGKLSDAEFDAEMQRIAAFERMLIEDQALILKFWFHLPRDVQKRRLKALSKDPYSRWRMARKRKSLGQRPKYDAALRVAERMIRETDNGYSPWYLIESTDRRYRDLTVGRTLLQAIQGRLENPIKVVDPPSSHAPHLPDAPSAQVTLLDHVDLQRTISKSEYQDQLKGYQDKLNELVWAAYRKKVSMVLLFEGWDAAGKGGAIRRLTQAMDARLYRVVPVAAPTDEERAHHYLWRFWRHVPRAGHITLFDRSWYGRVLVERVEGFASEDAWRRAYFEINEFEEQLTQNGIRLCKFWLHISKEEQLARFKAREQTPYKQWKITEEDWRNRERWDDYKAAVNEMVIRTSTEASEWTLVPANDKRVARVEVLRTVCASLAAALD